MNLLSQDGSSPKPAAKQGKGDGLHKVGGPGNRQTGTSEEVPAQPAITQHRRHGTVLAMVRCGVVAPYCLSSRQARLRFGNLARVPGHAAKRQLIIFE